MTFIVLLLYHLSPELSTHFNYPLWASIIAINHTRRKEVGIFISPSARKPHTADGGHLAVQIFVSDLVEVVVQTRAEDRLQRDLYPMFLFQCGFWNSSSGRQPYRKKKLRRKAWWRNVSGEDAYILLKMISHIGSDDDDNMRDGEGCKGGFNQFGPATLVALRIYLYCRKNSRHLCQYEWSKSTKHN